MKNCTRCLFCVPELHGTETKWKRLHLQPWGILSFSTNFFLMQLHNAALRAKAPDQWATWLQYILNFSSFNGNSSHLSYGKYLLTPITDGYTMTASNLDQKIFHSHLWWWSRIKFQDELQIKEISQKNVSDLKPFMVAKLYTWNTCDQWNLLFICRF